MPDFSLQERAAAASQTFELTEPFPKLRFDDAVQVVEAGGRFYVVERTGGSLASCPMKASKKRRSCSTFPIT